MQLFNPDAPSRDGPAHTQADVRSWKRRRRWDLTVGELVDRYLRHARREGLHGPAAYRRAERTLRDFVKLHGPLAVVQLRPFNLTDFVDAHEKWKAPATRKQGAAVVKAVFGWAVEQGRISRNPFAAVTYDEGEPRREMTDDLFDQLCRRANKPFEHFLRMLRYTGCRQGELRLALWRDVDLDRGTWTIPIHKTRKQTKRPKVKVLTPEALDLLRTIGPGPPDCPVLLNTRAKPWTASAVQDYLRYVKRRCGIREPVTLHSIRHQYATVALVNGAPQILVAELLGHANSRTVEKHYAHLAGQPEALLAAAKLAMPRGG